MKAYENLLRSVDAWFLSIRARYADQMQCGKGCARCCHGLFDISLPDAVGVAEGFCRLAGDVKDAVASRASALQAAIGRAYPELGKTNFLTRAFGDTIDEAVAGLGNARCPFLDEGDACLIYDHRPLACRLERLPMVDAEDGLIGDWCEMNFKNGLSPELERALCLDYYGMQSVEIESAVSLSQLLRDCPQEEVTLFLPSVIAAFPDCGALLKS